MIVISINFIGKPWACSMTTAYKHKQVEGTYNKPLSSGQESNLKWHIVTKQQQWAGLVVKELAGSSPAGNLTT